ncbi:hypothetical protein HYX00_03225 [Candidatus Woesearchaeota archaeon]|nr:hypothetical protein [Candidatus Woesearchaeota archaeon]
MQSKDIQNIKDSSHFSIKMRTYGGTLPPGFGESYFVILNDGTINYQIKNENGYITAFSTGKISKEELDDLISYIRNQEFFDIEDNYSIPKKSDITYHPKGELTVSSNGKIKFLYLPSMSPSPDYMPDNLIRINDRLYQTIRPVHDKASKEAVANSKKIKQCKID